MRKVTLLTLVVFMITTAAPASEKQEIAKCAAKDSDAARLICYDSLARSLDVDKPKTTITHGNGKWSVRIDRSPIDDSENVNLSVEAEENVEIRIRHCETIFICTVF